MTNGPPKNVEPADLWTKLTTMPRPHTEVAFPRKDPQTGEPMTDKVAIWVLTEAELMSARAASDAYAKKELRDPQKSGDANIGYQEIYRNAQVIEIIWRACRQPVNLGIPMFPSQEMIRRYFTSDEIAVLFYAYTAFQSESGPILSAMTPEEMDAWIETLVVGGSSVPLARLASETVKELLMHSASRLRQLRPDNGFVGSPPGDSSPSTDPTSSNPPTDSQ